MIGVDVIYCVCLFVVVVQVALENSKCSSPFLRRDILLLELRRFPLSSWHYDLAQI